MKKHALAAGWIVFLCGILALPMVCAEEAMESRKIPPWAEYRRIYQEMAWPAEEILLTAMEHENAAGYSGAWTLIEGKEAVLCQNPENSARWTFFAEEDGLFAVEITYYMLDGTMGAAECALLLDDALPFQEADQLLLPRLFADETAAFAVDRLGNDIRPAQKEIKAWQTRILRETEGYDNGAYLLALTRGEHSLTIQLNKEAMAIASVRLCRVDAPPSYADYGANARAAGDWVEVIEAEKPLHKTSTMLYAISDRSDAATFPSDPVAKKLNAIGGSNWKNGAQSITWEVHAPEDGWYTLSFRFKQDYLRGMSVYRRMEIDGRMPFAEMESVPFEYGVGWQIKTAGEEGPWGIYLSKGTHQLTLTPTTGELADVIYQVNETVIRLNALYRRIIMITGTSPDIYRDYSLHKEIPGLQEELIALARELRSALNKVESISGCTGGEAEILARTADQLESFARMPGTIPERLTTFSDNMISVSAWTLTAQAQSLLLDRIILASLGTQLPSLMGNATENIQYHLNAFLGSFVTDYEAVGSTADTEKTIKVWVSSGRDQAEVLKEMIDRTFTPKSGIGVELNIVQSGLMQAVMAGQGPDIALMLGHGDPVNYALRGAIYPLNDFEGFADMEKNYMPGALIPYTYQGQCYALPNSQSFFMCFYRTDIFEQLGLSAPETWDDLLIAAETLQRNNMNIGLPYVSQDAYSSISSGIGTANLFPTLLIQAGEKMYTDDGMTSFSSPKALHAFKTWTEYYTQYGFPLYKNDFSRFRTGEMPLVITGYTFYNQLQVAAPEIRNQWAMTLVPGTAEEGGINHATAASGTAGVILANTQDAEASWEFLKWWNSTEAQTEYGRNIENILGAAGRYNPANVEALRSLDWSSQELKLIEAQWAQVVEIEELPGSYYVSRNLDNAFKAVYNSNENYREALNYWNKQINAELKRKQEEYEQNR